MVASDSKETLRTLLEVTERLLSKENPERSDVAETVAAEILETLARRLKNDTHLHLSVLAVVCGQTLGRAAPTPALLREGVQALTKAAHARGVVALLRTRLGLEE